MLIPRTGSCPSCGSYVATEYDAENRNDEIVAHDATDAEMSPVKTTGKKGRAMCKQAHRPLRSGARKHRETRNLETSKPPFRAYGDLKQKHRQCYPQVRRKQDDIRNDLSAENKVVERAKEVGGGKTKMW